MLRSSALFLRRGAAYGAASPGLLLGRGGSELRQLQSFRYFADDAAASGGVSEAIVDITAANIQTAVMECKVPVILDCYADWCGPCKQLTPILEKVVKASNGKLRLAKLDVDNEQALAQQLQVKSLPTVLGIYKGRMVDQFVGMLPQEEMDAFLAKLAAAAEADGGEEAAAGEDGAAAEEGAASPMETAASLLAAGDPEAAAQVYKEVYAALTSSDGPPGNDPDTQAKQASALVGLASCAQASGDEASVAELLQMLKNKHSVEIATNPALASAVASLELAAAAPMSSSDPTADPTADLEAAVAADPEDLQSRLQLAQVCFQTKYYEDAINHALVVVRKDSKWQDEAGESGKDLLLKFFASLGADHELVKSGRKRLTNLLFV